MNLPSLPENSLADAFPLRENRYTYLIGGGGKTSLMFAIARAFSRSGRSVITTTSTKLLYPKPSHCDRVIIEGDAAKLVARLRTALPNPQLVTVGKTLLDGGAKIGGYTPDELDELYSADVADCWLIEADGSAGRSLKAHLDGEPVVSPHADMVIAVIGIDCVGKPLTEEHVHRSRHFQTLAERKQGTPITLQDITNIFFHPRGYLKNVAPQTCVTVFISKSGTPTSQQEARRLATALRAADINKRLKRIVFGELNGPSASIRTSPNNPT